MCMTRLKQFALLLTCLWTIQLSAQGRKLNGTWTSTNGLAMDKYTFDTTGHALREFIGDLSYFRLSGSYRQANDSIFLNYAEPDEELKKRMFRENPPVLLDTLYVVNGEKLSRGPNHLHIYLYRKQRDVPIFSVSTTGILKLSVRDFDDTILLMQKGNSGWVVVDTWTDPIHNYLTIRNYQLPLLKGNNEFRILVKQPLKNEVIKQFTVKSR